MAKTYYISYTISLFALLFSIKFPSGIYLGELFVKNYYNKLVIAGIFILSYYYSLKSVKKVNKRYFQLYTVIVSTLIFISLLTNLFW
ncbi:hypothetical protein [Anaerobranca gottschalkii]|uniref:Uncharacterized protein n=1 Tax=Anaerobranca gottschalkii DSM 13577 TaxID=1120990 RepID=A0A1H9ZW05_9FIRM|nr:hypothetical protein [Anaerobranca gottschalkii]SES85947.1 hypothetical protein SAMN03080614_10146 [Anaerobranca gottschalkii DSM 13577]